MTKKKKEDLRDPYLGLGKESFEFMENYLNNFSPTGHEAKGQKLWLDYITPFVDETFTDIYGTAVGVINPKADFKVVIEAHADEISWRVSHISESGYIYVKGNGGSDIEITPSKKVLIFTKKGFVEGMFGWPAIHVRTSTSPKPTDKNVTIDVGAKDKKEVEEMGIHVGSIVVYPDEMSVLNNRFVVGRALDNRMGGFMIAEVAKKLHKKGKKLPFGLYIVNSVQEEIGLRGAQMIANRIKPDIAIITDVTHDTNSPLYDKIKDGDIECGKGPVLMYAPAVQNNLLNFIIDIAEENKISFQRDVAQYETGTDTDAFAYSNNGVASALISLPLKYMHTTVETVHHKDVNNVIDLIYKTITNLKSNHNFKYL